jgi:hypothetical protein
MLAEAVRNTQDENKRLQQAKRVKAARLGRWPYCRWPFSWPMADGPTLSIVEIVVIAPRRRRGRTLQELRGVMARFARGRALGRIAADLGL